MLCYTNVFSVLTFQTILKNSSTTIWWPHNVRVVIITIASILIHRSCIVNIAFKVARGVPLNVNYPHTDNRATWSSYLTIRYIMRIQSAVALNCLQLSRTRRSWNNGSENTVRINHECEGRIEKFRPEDRFFFCITRLAEWWQTVIPRGGFFYPILIWIMNSFSFSPLYLFIHFKIRFQKSLNTLRCDFTWWFHLNITSWVRYYGWDKFFYPRVKSQIFLSAVQEIRILYQCSCFIEFIKQIEYKGLGQTWGELLWKVMHWISSTCQKRALN